MLRTIQHFYLFAGYYIYIHTYVYVLCVQQLKCIETNYFNDKSEMFISNYNYKSTTGKEKYSDICIYVQLYVQVESHYLLTVTVSS